MKYITNISNAKGIMLRTSLAHSVIQGYNPAVHTGFNVLLEGRDRIGG
jgi:hypothetical protein